MSSAVQGSCSLPVFIMTRAVLLCKVAQVSAVSAAERHVATLSHGPTQREMRDERKKERVEER